MTAHKEPRRANLATIVGSSLAVVAAGSLLAFSSLAEQAGLEGLATGQLQPAGPGRIGGGAHAIMIPAPATDAPRDPAQVLAKLVRDSRSEKVRMLPTVEATAPEPAPRPQRAKPKPKTPAVESTARVAVTPPPEDPYDEPADSDGPPYGNAWGHHKHDKNKHKAPKHKAPKHEPEQDAAEQPVYARSKNDDEAKPPKESNGPALQKVKKEKKEKAPANGNGKAKGHSKHAHKGKGKGHSKHGD